MSESAGVGDGHRPGVDGDALGSRPDIFISYMREDAPRVTPLAAELQRRGYSVFWDVNIPPGQTWRSYVYEFLVRSRCVLVLWSKKSVASKWVINEADKGEERNVLIPALLDDVEPPFGFSHIQAANLVTWEPGKPSQAFDDLLAEIARIVATSPSTSPSSQPPDPPSAVPPTPARHDDRSYRFLAGLAALGILVVGLGAWWLGNIAPKVPPKVKSLEAETGTAERTTPEPRDTSVESIPATTEVQLTGEKRVRVQEALNVLGFDTRGIDGIFGRNTRSAIRDWQRGMGVEATGYLTSLQLVVLLKEAEPKLTALEEARPRTSTSNTVAPATDALPSKPSTEYVSAPKSADLVARAPTRDDQSRNILSNLPVAVVYSDASRSNAEDLCALLRKEAARCELNRRRLLSFATWIVKYHSRDHVEHAWVVKQLADELGLEDFIVGLDSTAQYEVEGKTPFLTVYLP